MILSVSTIRKETCKIVAARSRSFLITAHGAWWSTYWLPMLESRIATLQEKLRLASVIQAEELSTDVVQVGSVVHVKDVKTGKSVKYTIVGSAEAKPQEHKLSNESPVGRALIGRKRNETVAVKVPRGPARKLKITKIDVGLK